MLFDSCAKKTATLFACSNLEPDPDPDIPPPWNPPNPNPIPDGFANDGEDGASTYKGQSDTEALETASFLSENTSNDFVDGDPKASHDI